MHFVSYIILDTLDSTDMCTGRGAVKVFQMMNYLSQEGFSK